MENRKKKLDIQEKKCNIIQSLQQVEKFLNTMIKVSKGKKLYNILKRK